MSVESTARVLERSISVHDYRHEAVNRESGSSVHDYPPKAYLRALLAER